MAEGGHKEELSHSTSEDGNLSYSLRMGSQGCYEYYCQPCNVDNNHEKATFYCVNCQEYMCTTHNMYHKKFKQMYDHEILDVRPMTYKPPISKNRPASTRAVTMATHVKNINVECFIRSSALMSTNQLLVADCDNDKVRLVDTISGSQVSELQLPGRPWHVTRISDTEAAVTLPYDKKIVLLRTKPQLSVVREISVQEKCYGVAYMDNTLIVSFCDRNVGILDMSGKVLRTISFYQSGREIFTDPHDITVDPVTGSMFVSDTGKWQGPSRVVKLSKEGKMLATYSKDGEGIPGQIALDTQGMFYVAWTDTLFGGSVCVEQLSANCNKVRTIIPDLSPQPQTLSYDDATQQLYVGLNDGVVKVYRLS